MTVLPLHLLLTDDELPPIIPIADLVGRNPVAHASPALYNNDTTGTKS